MFANGLLGFRFVSAAALRPQDGHSAPPLAKGTYPFGIPMLRTLPRPGSGIF